MGLFHKGGKALALKQVKYDLGNDTYVNVRELSATELVHYQTKMGDKDTSNMDFVFDLLSKCVVDDDGKPLFKDATDVKDHFGVGLSTLVDLQKKIMALSGLDIPKN